MDEIRLTREMILRLEHDMLRLTSAWEHKDTGTFKELAFYNNGISDFVEQLLEMFKEEE